MSHRKSHSYGSIPFSWEDKPGICKTPNKDYPLNIINPKPFSKFSPSKNKKNIIEFQQDKKIPIPLPPCPTTQPPQRSTSGKGFKLQQDPFLVAYKECTKSEKSCKFQSKNKKALLRNYCIFSCRNAMDVKDDSYVKLSRLPPLAKHRDRSQMFEDVHQRGFNYDSWF
ncbi:unnamed protein product [Vicia faba]|uniref:Uncharacterized protein n=1 Tax=Vicia faba TaxID=3906 RepID=A0AAV1AGC2_VICFA|nr:unnamed protein product [Vicia faba]